MAEELSSIYADAEHSFDYPLFGLRQYHRGAVSGYEPAVPADADQLTKLRWHAEVASIETGLQIEAARARSWSNGEFQPDRFALLIGYSGSITPIGYDRAKAYLDGVMAGVRAEQFRERGSVHVCD